MPQKYSPSTPPSGWKVQSQRVCWATPGVGRPTSDVPGRVSLDLILGLGWIRLIYGDIFARNDCVYCFDLPVNVPSSKSQEHGQ